MRVIEPAKRRWRTPISYIPLAMIYGLLALAYYVFVIRIQLEYYVKQHPVGSVLLLVFFHILLLLVLYTYTRLLARQPGFAGDLIQKVEPPQVQSSPAPQGTTVVDAAASPLLHAHNEGGGSNSDGDHVWQGSAPLEGSNTIATGAIAPAATSSLSPPPPAGRPRYCSVCCIIKPDRCHHCSQCNECVLRMDHHCPWVVGCVGYGNQKLFFLFLFYVSLLTLYVSATSAALLGLYMRGRRASDIDALWVAVTVLSGLWSLMLTPFAGMHAYQIITNQTTLEYMKRQSAQRRVKLRRRDAQQRAAAHPGGAGQEPPVAPQLTAFIARDEEDIRNPWQHGMLANWSSIMGENPWLWFVPISNSAGNGLVYPRTDAPPLGDLSSAV